MTPARITSGPFPGLTLIELEVHEDPERVGATFREVFRSSELAAQGLPAFEPVQMSIATSPGGTLRGIHAEPWAKYVHVVEGEVFAAIVDLDPGSATANRVWTGTLGPGQALLLQPGMGNSYQAVSDRAVYAYLVDAEWDPAVRYPAVRWDDPDLRIDWPITDERLQLSAKDRENPSLRELLDATGG